MRFAAPEWFLLVPILVYAGWRWRSVNLGNPLRFTCVILLLLLLVRPEFRALQSGLDLWLLVDRSASAEDSIAPKMEEIRTLLTKSKGSNDRLYVIDYAQSATLASEAYADIGKNREATRSALAIEFALAQMDPERANRLLLLTDGFSTEPLAGMREGLARQKVPLDYRIAGADRSLDWGITDFRTPARVRLGEPVVLEARIGGPVESGAISYELYRDDQKIFENEATIENYEGLVRLTDRMMTPGAHRYRIELKTPESDSVQGNNSAAVWSEIFGGHRLLLVTSHANDPVGAALRAQGYEVEEITAFAALSAASLTGSKVLILNNVPANVLPAEFLSAIDFYVRSQGGGLLVTGGKYSFGSGGYFQSSIDDLLPVSMELKQEHRKLAVAMSIVMDRSGSMAATVAGGITKMELADEGAARGVELLGPMDAVSVFAVDSLAHPIVPLTRVGTDSSKLTAAIRRVRSEGGGIFVYTGMLAAWDELKKAEYGQRHMILFADAADAEEPGDYKNLIAEMTKAEASVSVIALGSESDSDAEFLKDIAARGNGRIFFNQDAGQLPALFAQETVAIARSAYINEPVGLTGLPGWMEMAARPLTWPTEVDGYNLTYLRENATAAAITQDEYAAPLVAFWQREAGRVATVAFPVSGAEAQKTLAWPAYADFIQTLGRWLSGPEAPPGVGLKTKLDGERLDVDLFYDQALEKSTNTEPPKLVTVEGAGNPAQIAWQREAPGHFRATLELHGSDPLRGVVEFAGATFPFGPIAPATTPEWTFPKERLTELRDLSAASGGVERNELIQIWNAPRRSEFQGIQKWLATALLLFFLVETFVTRTGWRMPVIPSNLAKRMVELLPKEAKKAKGSVPQPDEKAAISIPLAEESKREAGKERRERFKRAKDGRG